MSDLSVSDGVKTFFRDRDIWRNTRDKPRDERRHLSLNPVYTIQPVVKPVWQPVWQQVISC